MRNKNTKKINKVMKGLGTNLKIAPMSCCTLFYVHFFIVFIRPMLMLVVVVWRRQPTNVLLVCVPRFVAKNVEKRDKIAICARPWRSRTDRRRMKPFLMTFFLFGSVVFVSVFCCVCKCTCLPLTNLHLCNSVRGIGWCHWQRIWFIFMN